MKEKKVKSILVQGFFGQSNFGDDILNIAGLSLCKKYFPQARVFVYSIPKSEYLLSFDEDVTIVDSTYGNHYDLIFHSGGGVFFDFKRGNFWMRILNVISRVVGSDVSNWAHDNYLKIVRKTHFETFNIRIGAGIGVGNFEKGSAKLFLAKRRLSGMNKLFVRDQVSIENLKKINVSIDTDTASDLAFSSELWLTEQLTKKQTTESIGVILRDWGTPAQMQHMLRTILNLTANGYRFNFFSFNPSSDRQTIKILKEAGFEVKEWNPSTMNISSFINVLRLNSVLISSRAHGAIVGAILEVPVVIIEIEPKLLTVHEMLPNASKILKASFSELQLIDAIKQAENISDEAIRQDVQRQSEKNSIIFEYLRELGNE